MIYPSKEQTAKLTMLVLGAGLIFGTAFSLIDYLCSLVVKLI